MTQDFEQSFRYSAKGNSDVILFFDNMIRRSFFKSIKKIADRHSGMICGTIGYNLSYDCDWIEDGVELWWTSGSKDHNCIISYPMFVDCIEVATNIWLKNNETSLNESTLLELEECIKKIKRIYVSH
ncbi:MAG: hypothetical protein MJ188_11090 [Treponema sp.]|nr:hypothetical protein [Treponema sp.]